MNNFQLNNYFTYKDEVSRTISWGHWFMFLNIFIALLIGCGYLYDAPRPSTVLGLLYLIISWLGHFSCIVFLVYLVLFFPLSFIGSLKWYRVLAITLSVVGFLILLVDVKLYQAIKTHINTSVLDLFFEQEGFSTGLNFNFLYVATPILIGIEIVFSHLAWKHIYLHNHQRLTYLFSAVFLLSFISTHILHIWANAYKYVPITIQKSLFPAYYPMTANTFLAEHGWIVLPTNEQIERTGSEEIISSNIKYPLESIKVLPKEKPYNVLFIFLNGLDFAHITPEYMPALSQFAKEHDSYQNHYIGINSGIVNSFELTYGLPGQYMDALQTHKHPPVIMQEMLQQDYKIQSFATGYDANQVRRILNSHGIRDVNIRTFNHDNDTTLSAIKWISQWGDRPQLTFVYLNNLQDLKQDPDIPLPYTPQLQQYKTHAYVRTDTSLLMNRYYNCLVAADDYFSRIIDMVATKDLLKNTVVIITSLQTFDFPSNDKDREYDRKQSHVPLIISWPNSAIPAKITALSGSQDIAPTIAQEVLGIKNDIDVYSTGQNLRELNDRPWILSGSQNKMMLLSQKQTIIFDKHGNASIYSDDHTKEQPNMKTLIKAMKILNRFKEK